MLHFECTVSLVLQAVNSGLACDVIKQHLCQFGVICTLDRSTLSLPSLAVWQRWGNWMCSSEISVALPHRQPPGRGLPAILWAQQFNHSSTHLVVYPSRPQLPNLATRILWEAVENLAKVNINDIYCSSLTHNSAILLQFFGWLHKICMFGYSQSLPS